MNTSAVDINIHAVSPVSIAISSSPQVSRLGPALLRRECEVQLGA
jgi:hypothetical protein